MDVYRAGVYLHIFAGVILTGLALFWAIMLVALGKSFGREGAVEHLSVAKQARWPHVLIPYALRIPLPWMTWLTLAVLVASGVFGLTYRAGGMSLIWWIKMALVGAVIVVQALSLGRPSPLLIRVNLALVLAVVVVSSWAIR